MGLRELEAAILAETRIVAMNKKIRQKDIMVWQTGNKLKARDGETLYYLSDLAISVAVKLPEPKAS